MRGDQVVDYVPVCERTQVACAGDGLQPDIWQDFREKLADAPRRERRAGSLDQERGRRQRLQVHESLRLGERRVKVERHLREARREGRALLFGQGRPSARPAPVIDKALHAARVIAAGKRTGHGVRHLADLGERPQVASPEKVEGDRLDQRQATHAVRCGKMQRHCAAVRMPDQMRGPVD